MTTDVLWFILKLFTHVTRDFVVGCHWYHYVGNNAHFAAPPSLCRPSCQTPPLSSCLPPGLIGPIVSTMFQPKWTALLFETATNLWVRLTVVLCEQHVSSCLCVLCHTGSKPSVSLYQLAMVYKLSQYSVITHWWILLSIHQPIFQHRMVCICWLVVISTFICFVST